MSRDVMAAARKLQAEFDEMGVGRQREYQQPSSSLVVVDPAFMDELTSVRQTLAPTLTDVELRVFALIAQRKGLDPFSGQIRAVKRDTRRGPVVTYQTGIDGYRSIAARDPAFMNSDDATFGDRCDCGRPPAFHPTFARVVVNKWHREAQRVVSQPGRADWHEYVPAEDFMWREKPHVMIAKCAEALALRKAFPWVLGDLYIPEEMARDVDAPTPAAPQAARSVVAARAAALRGDDDVAAPSSPPERPDDPPPAAPVPVAPIPDAGGPGASAESPASPPSLIDAREFQLQMTAAGVSNNRVREAAHELFPDKRSSDFTREDWGRLLVVLAP